MKGNDGPQTEEVQKCKVQRSAPTNLAHQHVDRVYGGRVVDGVHLSVLLKSADQLPTLADGGGVGLQNQKKLQLLTIDR